MASTSKHEKEEVNIVHQNAIFRETLAKEQRHQKLYTSFKFNPYNKYCVLAGKPNSKHDSPNGKEDPEFLEMYKRSQDIPQEKYALPQTEAQEIGWDTEPLVSSFHQRQDKRLHHPRRNSEITKYMVAAWKQKEQQTMEQ